MTILMVENFHLIEPNQKNSRKNAKQTKDNERKKKSFGLSQIYRPDDGYNLKVNYLLRFTKHLLFFMILFSFLYFYISSIRCMLFLVKLS